VPWSCDQPSSSDGRMYDDSSTAATSGRVAVEYFAFGAIKDAKRYLTGEGGVGADNDDGRGAAINAPSTTKDTEVGQGTEGGGKRGMGKDEPRTVDAVAMPTIVAAAVVALEEENKRRAGELLTAYGSIATKTMTMQPLQRQQMCCWWWRQNDPSCQGQGLYFF
jgi:hypothetical protein